MKQQLAGQWVYGGQVALDLNVSQSRYSSQKPLFDKQKGTSVMLRLSNGMHQIKQKKFVSRLDDPQPYIPTKALDCYGK